MQLYIFQTEKSIYTPQPQNGSPTKDCIMICFSAIMISEHIGISNMCTVIQYN